MRRSPVLDNRPATGEEHRMLSGSVYIGALERDWVGREGVCGVGEVANKGEIGQKRLYPVGFLSDSRGPWRHLF